MITSVRASRGAAGRHTTVDSSPRTWSAPVARPVTVRSPPGWSASAGADLVLVGPGQDAPGPSRRRPSPAARPRWPSTARPSCPGRRPPRAGPGAATGGGRPWRSPGRRRAGGAAGARRRRGSTPPTDVVEQALQREFVHDVHYPACPWPTTHPPEPSGTAGVRIGFLGPEGTFTEEALLTEPDYAGADITPFASLVDVLESVRHGHGRPGVRPPGERHRGHRPGHHRQPGLRLRPAHPARGGARHPPPPDGRARAPPWPTSSGWPRSRWPPPSAAGS